MEPITDLIYEFELKEAFQKQYPTAVIEDDHDEIHGSRFMITLPADVTKKDYFKFLFETPHAAGASLTLGLTMAMPKPEDVEAIKWAFNAAKGLEILGGIEKELRVKEDMIVERKTQ